jgi:tetratricopeptide (TPR) repeat protein
MVSRGAPYDDGKLSSLDVSIRVSLDSPRFKQEPDALRLLQLLSILPEGTQIGFLASMTGTGFSLDAAIVTLLRVSLATQDGGGTVKALSPIREHICSHFPISKDDLQTGFNYLKKETDSWRRCWGTEESANIHKRWVAQSSNILSFAREAISRPQDINPSASTRMSTNLFSLFYGHTATQPLDHLLEQAYETASAVARQATPAVPYLVAIQAILRLSYVTVGTDIDNIQTLESLVQVVREHGDPQMLGAALNNAAGIAGFEINAPHKVIAYAREIMQLDVMEISLKTLVDACSMTVILQWIGQTIMARDMLLSIKSTAESKGVDSRSKVEIESALAGFDEIRGFYSQGRRRLYSLLQTTELDRPTATNLHQMMSIACCQGRLDEAEKAGVLSYQIFYNLGLAVERAGLTLLQLSTLYLAQGRHQDALNTCIQYQETFYNQESKLRTLEILKLSLDPTLRLNPSLESLQVVNQKGFFDRGELLYLLGRMQSAFRVFIVSLIMECTAGYRLGVSMLFLRVGDYFRISEQDMATAECCYRASLQTIEFIGTPIHQADALARISLCQEYHGHLDTAAITLSRARARLTQAGLTHQIDILDRKARSVGLVDK